MKFLIRNRINFALWALAVLMAFPITAQAQLLSTGPYGKVTWRATTAADTATLTLNQVVGIVVGTPTAAANYTTPTATAMCNAFPQLRAVTATSASHFYVHWYVKNTSAGAFTITVVGGTGVTVSGTKTAAQNQVRHFIWQPTSCVAGSEAWNLYSLETAAF